MVVLDAPTQTRPAFGRFAFKGEPSQQNFSRQPSHRGDDLVKAFQRGPRLSAKLSIRRYSGMKHHHVGAGYNHGLGLFRGKDQGGNVKFHFPGATNHVDFAVVVHPGFMKKIAEASLGKTHGRKILNPVVPRSPHFFQQAFDKRKLIRREHTGKNGERTLRQSTPLQYLSVGSGIREESYGRSRYTGVEHAAVGNGYPGRAGRFRFFPITLA